MTKPLRLSYTKLSFYLTCPYKYYLRYEEKRPYYPGKMTKYGSNIHRSVKDFSEIIKEGIELTPQKQAELIENQWTSVTADKIENQRLKELSIQQMQMFMEKNKEAIAGKTLFCEEGFKYQINDNLILNGYIDRVDLIGESEVEIIDYKSGEERILFDDDVQLNFYALVIRDHYKLIPKILSLYFLSTHNKFSVDASNENINAVKDLILLTADNILFKEFSPTEKSYEHCPVCFYNRICPYALA